jgi:hypothetical protein
MAQRRPARRALALLSMLALLAACLCAPAAAQDFRSRIEAYPEWPSVRAGQPLALHVSSSAPRFDVAVFRQGEPPGEHAPRWHAEGLEGAPQPVPDGAPSVDCRWPVGCEIPVGADWPSGWWWARLSDPADPATTFDVPFIVRAAKERSRAPVLALSPECTIQAYDAWGGACLYPSRFGPPNPVVSLRRPHDPHAHSAVRNGVPGAEEWLRARGVPIDWAADVDLQREPDLLAGHDLLLLVGHHEYWSAAMRAAVEAFVGNGGRLLIVGANTCYWQIRFEQDGTAIRCHKRPERDALAASADATDRRAVSSTWLGPPVLQPQEALLGLAWQHAEWASAMVPGEYSTAWSIGGEVPDHPSENGYGAWRIVSPEAPDLAPLHAPRDATFGAGSVDVGGAPRFVGACGGEVDGALTEELDGARPASAALGAPRNLLVLADAPAQGGLAAIASCERGGEVLWCASERAALCLADRPDAWSDLRALVDAALHRLSRPRRNQLVNPSFEEWDGGAPRGWSAGIRRAGAARAITGSEAVLLGEGGPRSLSQTATLRGGVAALLVGHVRDASVPRSLELTVLDSMGQPLGIAHPVSSDGAIHAGWIAAPELDVPVTVHAACAPGTRLVVDQIELIEESALAASAAPLEPAEGGRLVSAPLPGGGRHLAIAWLPSEGAQLWLFDAERDELLAVSAPSSGDAPVLVAGDDRARGRMVRLALEARDTDYRVVSPSAAWLLPLAVPSPADAPLVDDGGFERDGTIDGGSAWSITGAERAEVTTEARLAGRAGLHVEAGDAAALVSQTLERGPGERLLALTAWARGAGELTLSLATEDGTRIARAVLACDERWRAANVECVPTPLQRTLRAKLSASPGARLDIDAVRLQPARDRLVDDLYPNGGFEIVPTPAELERGADWTARVPRWAVLAGGAPRLDDGRASSGRHSLKLEPGSRAATHLGWPIEPGRAAIVGARVWAEGEGAVTLRVQVGVIGEREPLEVARWSSPGLREPAWSPVTLAVPPEATAALATPDAWLVVDVAADAPGGAWIDELAFVAEE